MDVYNFNSKNSKNHNILDEKSTLLIGKFDVFHLGHKELLNQAIIIKNDTKIGATLFISENKKEVIPIKSRINNMAENGFDFVILIKLNYELKSMMANDFIDNITKKYNIENIVIGNDFKLGRNKMWNADDLKKYFKNTFLCKIKKINNIKISTTSIREMIKTGEISLINSLLINKYNPEIKYLNKKINWLGNLEKPHNGVYFIKIAIGDYLYHGLLHISMNQKDKIHLLNYDSENIFDDEYLIEIWEEARIIINSRFDVITENDKKNCLEFFYLLQKNNI